MNRNKKLGFTLAEVLIVIGIIGVVAALTLPNLNHATGDKETVTRLQKAYSILNEANDRAVAIYGPISTWSEECRNDLNNCWMKRIGEFLKISKSCDESQDISCDSLVEEDMNHGQIIYQLADGITFSAAGYCNERCDCEWSYGKTKDICIDDDLYLDINGIKKGKNLSGQDIFSFSLSESLGIITNNDYPINSCLSSKRAIWCTKWVMEYGNLDYLKADENGKCNDSNIILDGTTNTSCH